MIDKIEKDAVTALFPFMGKEPVIIDCGSNKGHWADIVLEEFNGNCELHLFDPNEKMISFCEIKYEYRRNITYNNKALDYQINTRPFFYFENFNNEISSFYKDEKGWDGLPMKIKKVETVSLDEYYVNNLCDGVIDYLKIDCEGFDLQVLKGCEELMSEDKIGIIQIEYSGHWQRGNHSFEELKLIADKYGYKVYRYTEGNFWEAKEGSPSFDNYFLTKYEIRDHSVGWNNEFILNTLELPKCGLVLEVGSFEGLTTKYICEKLLLNEEAARVICVDPMEDFYIPGDTEHRYFKHQYQRFLRNTRGLPVELKKGLSKDELPKLNALRFDLIYLDGDHRKDAVYFDACWAFAICKEHKYIIFDDYEWREETKEGIDKFLNEFSGSLQVVSKGYQVVIKKIHNQYNELTQSHYL